MADLEDGESTTVKGSGSSVYTLKNTGGVYSCSCPAWAHQGIGIEKRTCKHLRAYRGDEAEQARLGSAELTGRPARAKTADGEDDADEGPPLLLAHKWETDVDLRDWWLSEKLDGVRAYWDGKQFLSRLGNRFHAPGFFTEGFPSWPLDGELWGGRKKFQRTVGIVKRQDQSPLWKELLYVVFDAPSHDAPFEERLAHCRTTFESGKSSFVRVHEHVRCRDHDHLRDELARVEALGGEGLMVRQPRSRYEAGRSSTLLKVKSFHDAEAKVIDHVGGTGKHTGRLGSLLLELPDGTRFNAGTGFSDAEREDPPPIGAIVTFRYQELSDGGVPRFPSYVGVRDDVRWTGSASPPQTAPKPAAAKPSAAAPRPATQGAGRRRFEMQDGETRYFWEIERVGAKHRVRFGTFDAKVKTFGSEADADAALGQRIAEKLGKGFSEVDED